jgi:hypothetical protein
VGPPPCSETTFCTAPEMLAALIQQQIQWRDPRTKLATTIESLSLSQRLQATLFTVLQCMLDDPHHQALAPGLMLPSGQGMPEILNGSNFLEVELNRYLAFWCSNSTNRDAGSLHTIGCRGNCVHPFLKELDGFRSTAKSELFQVYLHAEDTLSCMLS